MSSQSKYTYNDNGVDKDVSHVSVNSRGGAELILISESGHQRVSIEDIKEREADLISTGFLKLTSIEGSTLWINPDDISSIGLNPDLTHNISLKSDNGDDLLFIKERTRDLRGILPNYDEQVTFVDYNIQDWTVAQIEALLKANGLDLENNPPEDLDAFIQLDLTVDGCNMH